jgi:hypothetical protein
MLLCNETTPNESRFMIAFQIAWVRERVNGETTDGAFKQRNSEGFNATAAQRSGEEA